jgi:hypothetical protein
MPASMMMEASGVSPKVSGKSSDIVMIGPTPGNTPMAVPSVTPMRQ